MRKDVVQQKRVLIIESDKGVAEIFSVVLNMCYELNQHTLAALKKEGLDAELMDRLESLKSYGYTTEAEFINALTRSIGPAALTPYRELILKHARLKRQSYEAAITRNGKDGLNFIREKSPHLIVLGLKLPDMSAADVIKTMQAENMDLPMIVYCGHDDPASVKQHLDPEGKLRLDFLAIPHKLIEVRDKVDAFLAPLRTDADPAGSTLLRPGHIELFCHDVERSRVFYTTVLGFDVVDIQRGEFVWLRLGDLEILLRPGSPETPVSAYQNSRQALVFYTDNLDRARTQLEANGLEFKGTDGSGTCLTFTDPDGNWFQLVDPGDH